MAESGIDNSDVWRTVSWSACVQCSDHCWSSLRRAANGHYNTEHHYHHDNYNHNNNHHNNIDDNHNNHNNHDHNYKAHNFDQVHLLSRLYLTRRR